MPVDFAKLLPQIRSFGDQALSNQTRAETQLTKLRESFLKAAETPDLKDAVLGKLAGKGTVHIALPTEEAIDSQFSSPAGARQARTILAADGSQVVPNRHEEIRFGLINIALFQTQPGSGKVPLEIVSTQLLDEFEDRERLDEYRVSYLRDLEERCLIADMASSFDVSAAPVVALTDGPISIFQQRKPLANVSTALPQADRERFEKAHSLLEKKRIVYAGYVDRPGSDLVARMVQTAMDEPTAAPERTKLLSDAGLFAPLLAPLARSALFRLATVNPGSEDSELLAVYFFYLNIQGAQPHRQRRKATIARVEIPEWIAKDRAAVDTLHETLISQSGIIDGMLYPYALQRAHEIALVRVEEKERIKAKLMGEMARRGLILNDKSEKQRAKDLINFD